jgi:peptidyl-prolyl cis-trans isomerase D
VISWMRRYRKALNVTLVLVAGGFAASLFVFGASGFRSDDRAAATIATVDGESISTERYQRRYQAYLDAYSQMYRDRFTPELAERMGLPQQVVNDLVQEAVIVRRARAEGMELGDEELNARIQAIPAFQEGGRFSLRRYQEFLRGRRMSAAQFETEARREFTRLRVEQTVKSGVKVSEAEVERAFALQREEVRAAWAMVDLMPLVTGATATDAELETYLKSHGDEFRLPERRTIQYVTFSPRDFQKPVTEADLETYYTEHAGEFEVPREAQTAHILLRIPDTGGSAAEDRARAKAVDLIRRIKAGEDFAKLARENSEDPGSASRGGDLGWVRRGETLPAFEQAMFGLKKGEVSPEPVRTPVGFHVIKVTDMHEGGKKPLKDVATPIRERLQTEAAERAAKAKAEEMRPALQAAADFMAEAKKLTLTPVETTVSRSQRPAGAALPPDSVEDTVFALALGGVSAPTKTPAGFLVIKAIAQLPAAVPPLTEIKDRVTAAVKRQKAEAVAVERAKQIATEATSGDFDAVARKGGASLGEARFSRTKPDAKLAGDVMLAALETPKGGVTEPVKTPQGVYVLRVLERTPPDGVMAAEERDKLTREVLTQKQGQAWTAWLDRARAQAKVEISARPPAPRS